MAPNWDINQDGECTVLDLLQISNHYGETGSPGWIREDVDNDGEVKIDDLNLLHQYFGGTW